MSKLKYVLTPSQYIAPWGGLTLINLLEHAKDLSSFSSFPFEEL